MIQLPPRFIRAEFVDPLTIIKNMVSDEIEVHAICPERVTPTLRIQNVPVIETLLQVPVKVFYGFLFHSVMLTS